MNCPPAFSAPARPGGIWRLVLAPALGLTLLLSATADPVVLVGTNATWRYFPGRSHPSPAAPSAWRDTAFPEAAWPQGPAPFWYGESARFGGTGTELTDMQNQYASVFLRRRFSVANPAAWESLQFSAMCDDGYRAWINGRPIASVRAPTGEPAHTSLASANAPEPVDFEGVTVADADQLLVAGDNVLAVQIFNTALGSSDLVFEGELSGEPRPLGPPTISRVDPPPGVITNLTGITVTFNEPVRGVQAEAFLVNGASALAVSGSGTTYTFTFAPPPFGPVEVSWSTFHAITDFEDPPQRFELAAPGSVWGYELLDPVGPSVLTRQPPAGRVVGSLAFVEVTFNKAVAGLEAADLTLNGVPARTVVGLGAGPYRFEFPQPAAGPVTAAWRTGNGIVSDTLEPHPLNAGSWEYLLDPAFRPPPLVITEFMAENFTTLRDEENDPEDWVEIHNPTSASVPLEGWSLTNDDDDPGRWTFPAVDLPAGGYLVVFASGKDRRPPGGAAPLHTNFKLNPNGGYLALSAPELPRPTVSALDYPVQGPNYAYGRDRGTGVWRYFETGSPGALNPAGTITDAVAEVHFSVPRGFFASSFDLTLHCPTPGAFIRYTTNGSPPTATVGFLYDAPLRISANRVIRAAAFKDNALPSRVATHTYLVNLPASRLRLPALSLVTATNHLYGRSGIMEVSPRNTTKRGPAWERPVSVEYLRTDDNGGFQTDCGLRLQGGDYVRGQYNYRTTSLPFSKYSFRLYFRGEYGLGRLEYPLFPETTQRSFDTVVLRAGMNDHSNPYLTDEFVRSLARDCGQPSAVGTFVHLFLNGVYKGYYNPCERIDVDFLRAYHGGGEDWDVMAQAGEVREGTATDWNSLRTLANTRDLTLPANYRDLASRLDLTNVVDYLCPLIYADNDDWPHNNWRAARERAPNGLYRLYVWDAEWAFGLGNGHGPSWNTIANQLSSTSPPWGGTDIQRLFLSLKKAPEFRLLFADRVHRHFFNGGALTDDRLRARYADITNRLNGVVPGFNNRIGATWIPQRRRHVLQHFERAGFLASSNAPVFGQHGGTVPDGFTLLVTNLAGSIHFTTNGADPRLAFTGDIAPDALTYRAPFPLTHSVLLRARSLQGTNWSALTEARFEVNPSPTPLRITEIQYHPPGGNAFEFIELANLGALPLDLAGVSFRGIEFRFPEPSPAFPAGARWVVASDERPEVFQARYPELTPVGWFGGSLNNAGERLELLDRNGAVLDAVEYSDRPPWPHSADGLGPSLELVDVRADPHDPAAWSPSRQDGGSPGAPPPPPSLPTLRLSEIVAALAPAADWIELGNFGPDPVALDGWGLTDNDQPHRFRFPAGTSLAPGERLRLWCGPPGDAPGIHTGFGLDRNGETVALYDAATNRIDIVTFGAIPPGFGLGRLDSGSAWGLTEPTPAAPNEPATLAAATHLALNEWLANPPAGDDDWLEFHNRHPAAPVSLQGLTVAVDTTRARIGTPNFVPPSGFLVLRADGGTGPDHLGLRLPAAGGVLTLLDDGGAELSRITLASVTTEGLTYGRHPDGTGVPRAFPGTPSPGGSNYVATVQGPRLHEWMARNHGAVLSPEGRPADWIELFNPGPAPFDLGGGQLRVGNGTPTTWSFPSGVQLAVGAHLLVWCDPAVPPSLQPTPPLHLGRGLAGEGGRIELVRPNGQVLDALAYGPQLRDQSVGRTGSALALLTSPTPGQPNAAPAPLGAGDRVRINEWLAQPGPAGADWFELHNPQSLPVDLGGYVLTDDPSLAGLTKHPLPPLSFLAPGGHVRWIADGQTDAGTEHVGFSLSAQGETLRLLAPNQGVVDSIAFTPRPPGTAAGRFPDGADAFADFPESASPGSGNWLPHPGVVINELLAHTDPPLEDAIELLNPSLHPTPIGGWWLSDDALELDKFQLPTGRVLAPGAFDVLFANAFNAPDAPRAFGLSAAEGGDLWLSEVGTNGLPTGYRAHASFEATANAISVGRFATSLGWEFVPLSRRTFGKDAPASLAEFRQSGGLPNAYPLVGPVVLNEIHYRPLPAPTDAGPLALPEDLEFIELHNSSRESVPLFDPAHPTHTWRLRGGVDFDLPREARLEPEGFALIVAFDPARTALAEAFRARFQVPASVPLWGPFSGRLSNEADDLRLERPDRPQGPAQPDAGLVPYLLVERVRYAATAPWPGLDPAADQSLQRRRAAEFGNDPVRWLAATPTAGAPTAPPSTDRDRDGLPDAWELAHGLDPDNPADADLDLDADGHSNRAEHLAGTDPRSAASLLRLALESGSGTGYVLRFRAMGQRSYTLETRGHAASGTWLKHLDIPVEAADRDVTVPLDVPATQQAFYRIVSPATP